MWVGKERDGGLVCTGLICFQDREKWQHITNMGTNYIGEISPTRCNQQLRFLFAMALLYMFRVTISPIIRSTMLYMATGELAHLGCY